MNFDEWLKSDVGKKCADYPITHGEYLRNRLWWAFSAGEQYARDKLAIEFAEKHVPEAANPTQEKP